MPLKHAVLTASAFALCVAVNAAPADAQGPNCGDMYNRVMQLYQIAPQSLEYAQMSGAYSASCLGASAGRAYSAPAGPSDNATTIRANIAPDGSIRASTTQQSLDANGQEVTEKHTYRSGPDGTAESHSQIQVDPDTGSVTTTTTTTEQR
jgi:hypothetical protein